MKAFLVLVILAISATALAQPYVVVFDREVKNLTCARASVGLVQRYLKTQKSTLQGHVAVRLVSESQTYLVVNDVGGSYSVEMFVNVIDMRGEDGTCTATHIKFENGPWLNLQKMAYSWPYPKN